jgi:hypothetical protein
MSYQVTRRILNGLGLKACCIAIDDYNKLSSSNRSLRSSPA